MKSQLSNEQLCVAALDGDTEARNALVENNLRFIKRTAYEMWSAQQELNAALGIEINDLVQEGSLGLLDCIAGYRPDTGNKFLTYAAPAIRNAMVDYIRKWNPTFEAKNLGNIVRLDDVVKDENKGRNEFIADSRIKNPEQIAGIIVSALVLAVLIYTCAKSAPWGYACGGVATVVGFLKYRNIVQYNSLTVKRFRNTYKEDMDVKKFNKFVETHF